MSQTCAGSVALIALEDWELLLACVRDGEGSVLDRGGGRIVRFRWRMERGIHSVDLGFGDVGVIDRLVGQKRWFLWWVRHL